MVHGTAKKILKFMFSSFKKNWINFECLESEILETSNQTE